MPWLSAPSLKYIHKVCHSQYAVQRTDRAYILLFASCDKNAVVWLWIEHVWPFMALIQFQKMHQNLQYQNEQRKMHFQSCFSLTLPSFGNFQNQNFRETCLCFLSWTASSELLVDFNLHWTFSLKDNMCIFLPVCCIYDIIAPIEM